MAAREAGAGEVSSRFAHGVSSEPLSLAQVTYVETKLVLSFDSSSGWSESVPPTICLTTPPWRSMHGRKSDRRWELEAGDEAGDI